MVPSLEKPPLEKPPLENPVRSGAMRLVRPRDGAVVVPDLREAAGFLQRARGLMGRRALDPGEGLWLEPCNSIHMFAMRFPIDVLFLRGGRSGRRLAPGDVCEVLRVCAEVRPWIGLAWCFGASSTLELAAGGARALGIQEGDALRVEAP